MEVTPVAFTTYAALHQQLLDDLADGNYRSVKSYSVGTRQVSYHSMSELLELIAWAKTMAGLESGAARGRTYVKRRV